MVDEDWCIWLQLDPAPTVKVVAPLSLHAELVRDPFLLSTTGAPGQPSRAALLGKPPDLLLG